MRFTRIISTSAVASGIALAGLTGIGAGTASADPGAPCGRQDTPACRTVPGNDDWQHRGMDQGRQDHRPFMYNGQQVRPLPAGNGDGWGFWFLGRWIRL
jgi:hypothetical protein